MITNPKVLFVGLGNMGWHMAGKLGKIGVYNRTIEKSRAHAEKFQTYAYDSPVRADTIICCLPKSEDVQAILREIKPNPGTLVIDTTSGDPYITREISKNSGIRYVDAPISGGPHGAKAATLTSMIGADSESDYLAALPFISKWSNMIYRTGDVGTAHAVKAINNALNATHLAVAAEALTALQKFGISEEAALRVINKSSGRSLATEERIPNHVLRHKEYGFKLGLMAKDVNIAHSIVACVETESIIAKTKSIVDEHLHYHGYDVDYTILAQSVAAGSINDIRR